MVGDALPLPPAGTIQIYRGVRHPEHDGISWTLSYDRARWFALRWSYGQDEGYVLEAAIPADEVLCYFDDRGEDEVLVARVDPGLINVRTVREQDPSQLAGATI